MIESRSIYATGLPSEVCDTATSALYGPNHTALEQPLLTLPPCWTLLDYPRRNAYRRTVSGQRFRNHRPCANNAPISDLDALNHGGACADIAARSYTHISGDVCAGRDRSISA